MALRLKPPLAGEGNAGLCSPHAESRDRRHGVSKAFTIDRLRQHRRSRYSFADALDGIGVGVSGDKDDGYVAKVSKPPGNLNPFTAPNFRLEMRTRSRMPRSARDSTVSTQQSSISAVRCCDATRRS